MDSNSRSDQFCDDESPPQNFHAEMNEQADFNSVEYFKSLETWVQDVLLWQHFNFISWQSFLLNQPYQPSISFRPSGVPLQPINAAGYGYPNYQAPTQIRGIECRVPPLWKRLLAELIDFVCLFMIKLVATFILIDFLDIIDWNKYDFDALMQKTWRLDYSAAIELTSELMLVEFAHRITVCLFESFWLHRGFRGVIGGSTPGKKLMNLRVVYCEKISTLRTEPDLIVLVEPGTDLGVVRASIRAFLKNFVLALFLPFTFTFLYFQYNRTIYDLLAQSVVVEDPLRYRTNR